MTRRIAVLCLAGFAVAAVVIVSPARRSDLPDPRLTPGALIPGVTSAQTCDPAWTRRSRDVPDSLKIAVFRAYGIDPTPANRKLYEIDHRVPVALGGQSSLANLWPEPWADPDGAHTKDRLEFHCYREVCAGRMTLATAQSLFLGDWKIAYADHLGGLRSAAPDEGDTEGFPVSPTGPDGQPER